MVHAKELQPLCWSHCERVPRSAPNDDHAWAWPSRSSCARSSVRSAPSVRTITASPIACATLVRLSESAVDCRMAPRSDRPQPPTADASEVSAPPSCWAAATYALDSRSETAVERAGQMASTLGAHAA